jgi:hypothetical protein
MMPLFAYFLSTWLLFPPAALASFQDNPKPLSLEQIRRLIQNGFPDTALAGEIRDRGIDFSETFDRQTFESLRLLGAQEKTLRALEPYLPKAAVRVVTKLDRTIVLVDGKQYGTTDSTGVLQINDLEPGEHLIEIRNRPRYKDGQLRVVLLPRTNQEVVFEPEINVGTLTITPLTPNLEVTVYNELASLTGIFARRELAPGVYTLQARSRWHRPITQIIQIQAGQHLTLPIALERDEELLEAAILEAQKSFSAKDYTKSINTLLEVLNVTPRNLTALNLLAQTYLRINDTPNFLATAKRILDADGTVDVALLMHTEKKAPQPVRLQLSRTALTVEWLDSGDTQTFPLEHFSRAFIRGDVQSEVFLVLAGTRTPKRTPDLVFSVANTYDPRDESREPQLSQRDKINLLWNIEEIIRFSLEVHKEFLSVTARTNRPTPETNPLPPAAPPDPVTAEARPNQISALPTPPSNAKSSAKKDKDRRKEASKQPPQKANARQAPLTPVEPESSPRPTPTADTNPTAQRSESPSPRPGLSKVTPRTGPKTSAKQPPQAQASAADSHPSAPAPKTSPVPSNQPTLAKGAESQKLPKQTEQKAAQKIPATPAPLLPPTASPAVDLPPSAPSSVRARALIGTVVGALGGRANIERIAAAQFSGTQTTTDPDLTSPTSVPDPKPIRQFWSRKQRFRFEVSPGSPTSSTFLQVEKAFWQRANGRTERITQPELLKQIRMQAKLAAGVGLYQQLLSPENKVLRFSRHMADGSVEETIRVTDRDGDTYDVVIDLAARRPQKCVYQLPTALGQMLFIEERYEDFRLVNDIWLPHRVIRSVQGGRTTTLTFTDIQLPPQLSSDVFRSP